jgi:O-Antigen ligase
MNVISDSKTFRRLLIFFFAFGLIFPTLRVLLMGNATSTNIFQYLIASVPELIVLTLTIHTCVLLFRAENKMQLKKLDWMVLGFITSNVILGFILAQNIKLSLYGFRMTYLPMLFYFLIRLYDIRDDALRKMLFNIFLTLVFFTVAGHILYFFIPDIMVEMILKSGGEVTEYFIMRMTSLLWTPVVFGTFTIAGFLYFFYRALKDDRWTDYFFMAILWSGTVLSISRGAVISLLFGLIIFSCYYFKRRVIIKTFVMMTAVLILISNLFESPSESLKWFWKSSIETASLKKDITRVELWKMGYKNLKQHPFGRGLGMSGHIGTRFMNIETKDADIYSTDGWYLKLGNETGVWGLLSYLALSITFVVALFKQAKRSKDVFLFFLLVFFIAFNTQNMVSNVLDFYLFSYLFWLLMGIAVNQYYKNAALEQ